MVEQPHQNGGADGPSVVPPTDANTNVGVDPPEEYRTAGERFQEHFQALLPLLQEHWPEIAREQLEATRGSLDAVAQLIASRTSRAQATIREQLLELLNRGERQAKDWGEVLQPLEERLEDVLKDLNTNLQPQLVRSVRRHPLLSLGIAVGVGLLLGLLIKPSHHR